MRFLCAFASLRKTHSLILEVLMLWILFALGAALSWGLYGPALHRGQVELGNPMRALLCVGVAYFLIGVLVPVVSLSSQGQLNGFTMKGSVGATVAGALGAAGAVCIIFAFRSGGLPTYVMPLVFAGAPLVNVLYSMWLHPPKTSPNPLLYLGFVLAAVGGGLVLYFKPRRNAEFFVSPRLKEFSHTKEIRMKNSGFYCRRLRYVGFGVGSTRRWPSRAPTGRSGVVQIATASRKKQDYSSSGPRKVRHLSGKRSGAGRGYSSFSVANGKLYTMGLRGDREFVVAFDVATGKEAWATPHGCAFRNDRGDGPRGTPTVDGDRVYALGGNGDLSALDARTGKIVWSKNVLKEFGGSNITWGISESPLVLGNKVLVNAGGPGASIVALNKADGSVIWKSQSDRSGLLVGYSGGDKRRHSGRVLHRANVRWGSTRRTAVCCGSMRRPSNRRRECGDADRACESCVYFV